MPELGDFAKLIRRVRAGDVSAAEELVKRYEADLRIIARVRLNDPRLRRVVDSMDICQSIFGNFFIHVYAGQFDLETPEKLMKLLSTMVKNKVTDHARRQMAGRRDMSRDATQPVDEYPVVVAGQLSPSSVVANDELVGEIRKRLTNEELSLVDLRMRDVHWDAIAEEFGGSPDALRKKMTRALDRVAAELGL